LSTVREVSAILVAKIILREFAGVFINAFDCYSGDYDPYKVASIIGGTSLPFSDIYVNF
jgi:hypothetical protein